MGLMLTITEVTRVDADRTRLQPTSLHIDEGTVVAIVGPNGAGKSTLLSLMAGELEPTSGQVELAGRPLTDYVPMELARTRALMAQQTPTTFAFRVRDVVGWGRYCWRNTPEAIRDDAVIEAALADQRISDLADRPVTELSGGERSRTHLARVIAQDASLLFLDEADADLDLAGRAHLDEVVHAQRAAGRTLVLVSHDLARMRAISDMVIAVQSGRVVQHGPAEEVLTTERVAELFEVSPAIAARSL